MFRRQFDPVSLAVAAAIILTSALAAFFLYGQAEKEVRGIVRERLQQIASLAAIMTDADAHSRIQSPADMAGADYLNIKSGYLDILNANTDLAYIYTIVTCKEALCIVLDAEVMRPGENLIPSAVMEPYQSPSETLKRVVQRGLPEEEAEPYTDEFGTFLSAYAPVKAKDGRVIATVGVDMSYANYVAKIARLRNAALEGFGLAVLVAVLAGYFIALMRRKHKIVEGQHRSIMANIATVIFECQLDDNLTLLFVNDYITQLTGYLPGELVNNRAVSFVSLIHPEDLPAMLSGIHSQLERGNRFEVECRLLPKARAGDANAPRPVWTRVHGVCRQDDNSAVRIVEGFVQNVTVRKIIETKIAESEKKFRALADSMPNLLWITDAYGDTHFYNKTWLDYTGRTFDDEVEDGWTANIHPEDRDSCLAKFIGSLATEKPFQCWFRLRRDDGEYRWMLAVCTPRFTPAGKCDGYIGAATDITDRKAFETTLKRTNQQLELFFRHTPAAIAVVGTDMKLLMASERWKLDYGVSGQDVIGKPLYDVVKDTPGSWYAEHVRCLSGEIVSNPGECYLINGREEWISYTLHPWLDESEVGGMIMFSEVITERKRLDEELQAYRVDLEHQVETQTFAIRRESHKNLMLRRVIAAANEAHDLNEALRICLDEVCHYMDWTYGHCYLIDPSTGCLKSAAWSGEALQYEPDLVRLARQNSIPASDDQPWGGLQSVAATLLAERGLGGLVTVPIQVDGHRLGKFEFLTSAPSELDPEASRMMTDIGVQFSRLVERFRQDESLRAAKNQAEDLARAKSEFLSNMSHELRTPMHAILNYAGMGLKRLPNLPADNEATVKLTKYLSNIQTAGDRLMGLLNNLLDLAKMEAGRMTYQPVDHDLAAIVEQTRMELDSLMKAKGLTLDVTSTVANTVVSMDPARMMQVMVNLFSNAIKFSPEGGRLSLGLHAKAGRLLCTLADEGRGIPEAELEHIFEVFMQSSDTKSGAGGTGLGLSICRQIIMAHGGEIWAENNPGGGARMTFALPMGVAGENPDELRLAG